MIPPIIKAITDPNKMLESDDIDFFVVKPYKAIPANNKAVVKKAEAIIPKLVVNPMTAKVTPFNTENPISIPNACPGFVYTRLENNQTNPIITANITSDDIVLLNIAAIWAANSVTPR